MKWTDYSKAKIIGVFILMISISACQRSEVTSPAHSGELVKVFNDSTQNPDNSSFLIAASSNRFYLGYGTGIWNQFEYLYNNYLVVTDENGGFISKYTFPVNFRISDMMVLDDGSLLVSVFNYNNWQSKDIYLYRFSENGKLLMAKSFRAGCFSKFPNFYFMELMVKIKLNRSLSGNILVTGAFWDEMAGPMGFVIECDINANLMWSKVVGTGFGDCIVLKDGYMMISYENKMSDPMILYKVNASGDTVWTRKYKVPPANSATTYSTSRNLIALANGHYLLEASMDTTDYNARVLNRYMEVDADGRVVYSKFKSGKVNRYTSVLLQKPDGNVLAVTNSSMYGSLWSNGNFNQVNSSFLTLGNRLETLSDVNLQGHTSDVYIDGCLTPEGKIALLGITQSHKKNYYKPILIVLK